MRGELPNFSMEKLRPQGRFARLDRHDRFARARRGGPARLRHRRPPGHLRPQKAGGGAAPVHADGGGGEPGQGRVPGQRQPRGPPRGPRRPQLPGQNVRAPPGSDSLSGHGMCPIRINHRRSRPWARQHHPRRPRNANPATPTTTRWETGSPNACGRVVGYAQSQFARPGRTGSGAWRRSASRRSRRRGSREIHGRRARFSALAERRVGG